MKKIAFVASLAAVCLAFTAFISPKTAADSSFEGIITYSVSVDNPQAAAFMSGASLKIYMKGEKSKSVNDMGYMKVISFGDTNAKNKSVTLMEAFGSKYQVKQDDSAKKDEPAPFIKDVDGTKEIAGYTCKKAMVSITSSTGATSTSFVYYTDQLPAYKGRTGEFKGLKGFPLEFSLNRGGMNITFSAITVKKQKISDDTFTVPASGYKLMSQEDIQKDIQKNAQDQGGN